MSKADWVWMPHAGHFCASHRCRFHLNTYVNGYIVSTVGELDWDQDIKRNNIEIEGRWPKFALDEDGKYHEVKGMSDEEKEKLLSLKGYDFDAAYLAMFGFEELGMNRKYETMVFRAKEDKENNCCPWTAQLDCLDMEGYISAGAAYMGHLDMCEKWDKEVPSSEYREPNEI